MRAVTLGYTKGLVGVEKGRPTTERITYRCDFGPVIEQLPKVFKILGLVSLRDVDRLGVNDMDVVGMEHV